MGEKSMTLFHMLSSLGLMGLTADEEQEVKDIVDHAPVFVGAYPEHLQRLTDYLYEHKHFNFNEKNDIIKTMVIVLNDYFREYEKEFN